MKKVLFVDDSEIQRKVLGRIFEKEDVDYIACSTIEEFLSASKKDSFSVFIVDLTIEKTNDGLLAIKALRNTGNKTPIIVASSSVGNEQIEASLESGASDFICKPIDRAILMSKISNVVKSVEESQILPIFRVPQTSEVNCRVDFMVDLVSMSETEVVIKSKTFFYKECLATFKKDFLNFIGFDDENIKLKVKNSIKIQDTDDYLTTFSFPLENEDLLARVRFTLSN